MWSEAIEMLDRAERLHREMFRPARAGSRVPTWEPPVDVMETESAVIVLVALPGVEPGRIDVSLDRDVLSLSGTAIVSERIWRRADPSSRTSAGSI